MLNPFHLSSLKYRSILNQFHITLLQTLSIPLHHLGLTQLQSPRVTIVPHIPRISSLLTQYIQSLFQSLIYSQTIATSTMAYTFAIHNYSSKTENGLTRFGHSIIQNSTNNIFQ